MDGDRTTSLHAEHAMSASVGVPHFPPLAPSRRRWSRARLGFLAATVLPTAFAAVYLFAVAPDQYVSEFRFSVRQNPATQVQSNSLAQGLGAGTSLMEAAIDSQIVVGYIGSHQIIDDLRPKLDLDTLFAATKADPLATLRPHAPAEAKLRYWRRMVDPFFDLSSGLVTVKVRAFDPQHAQTIANAVLGLSEALVNRLSERARHDKLAYSDADVADRRARFAHAEAALSTVRNTSGIVFPQVGATENATLDAALSQQIAQAQTQYATLAGRGVSAQSPQLRVLQTRIAALQVQLRSVQAALTGPGADPSAAARPGLATALSTYDAAEVEDQIARHAYETALDLQQQAQSAAAQQQVYLNAFVQPDLPQSSLYPRRWIVLLEVLLASCTLWALCMLLVYGVREHLD